MAKTLPDPVFPIYQVDAFAEPPYRGNPAGVCFLMGNKPDQWMQDKAHDVNLSETAFFQQRGDRYTLRWFTPTKEVDLCGHATLATAHIIWETEMIGPQEVIEFETRSGILKARREGAWIVLDFPSEPAAPAEAPEGIEAILGAPVLWSGANRMDYLFRVADAATLKALEPDLKALGRIGMRGAIVTAPSDSPKYDFVSRYFAPAFGVPEDPVTGSAHCCLGPYWAAELGKSELTGYQASARGGIVKVVVQGDRVLLKGKAVTVMQGVFTGEEMS